MILISLMMVLKVKLWVSGFLSDAREIIAGIMIGMMTNWISVKDSADFMLTPLTAIM